MAIEGEGQTDAACGRAARKVQAAIVAFFALAAASLVVIYIVAPGVYVQVLLNGAAKETRPLLVTALMVAILLFVLALTVGVLRRWRWLFWLVLIAFGFSALQVPAGALELAGIIPSGFPTWYTVYRTLLAVPEVAIAVAMLRLWRRCGVWGSGR